MFHTEIEKEFIKLVRAFEDFADKWGDYDPVIKVQICHNEVTEHTGVGIVSEIKADDFGVSLALLYDNYKYADDYDE
jgi:hypothetical protein